MRYLSQQITLTESVRVAVLLILVECLVDLRIHYLKKKNSGRN